MRNEFLSEEQCWDLLSFSSQLSPFGSEPNLSVGSAGEVDHHLGHDLMVYVIYSFRLGQWTP